MFVLTDDSDGLDRLCDGATTTLRIGQLSRVAGEAIHVLWQDGARADFAEPNMMCVGFVALTTNTSLRDSLRAWWLERSGMEIDVCIVPGDAPETRRRFQIWSWVFDRVGAHVDVLHKENRELMSQNRALRRSYGALQGAFSRLEGFVSANRLMTPILQYETIPIVSYWKPNSAGGQLNQLLPILSSRLSYFDLNFRKEPTDSENILRLALRLEPSTRVLHEWNIPYRDVLNGWNSFTPPPIVDEENECLIELTWSGNADAPAVGLSAGHWSEAYGVGPAAPAGARESLAMRVWSGLQGVRPPSLARSPISPSVAPGRRVALAPDSLTQARLHQTARTKKRDYEPVRPSDPIGLLVHPHEGEGATIAILPETLPEGTTYVSAGCRTASPDAAPIEYAMGVVPRDIAPEVAFDLGEGPSDGFSGWHKVGPLEPRRIGLALESPTRGDERLCLATRLPLGSSEVRAWATWSGVEIGIRWRPKTSVARTFEGRPAPAAIAGPAATHASSPPDRANGVKGVLFPLAPEDLFRARQYETARTKKRDYEAVRPSDQRALLVHPHEDEGPTIAILPDALPAGTTYVSAECRTAAPDATPIEYAIGVWPRVMAFEFGEAPSDGFSGWRKIGPGQRCRIDLALETPTNGDESLCLATRLPPGSSEFKAWATWAAVEIGVGWAPRTTESESPRLLSRSAAADDEPERTSPSAADVVEPFVTIDGRVLPMAESDSPSKYGQGSAT
jgi:hypothetical protein